MKAELTSVNGALIDIIQSLPPKTDPDDVIEEIVAHLDAFGALRDAVLFLIHDVQGRTR